MKGGTARDWLMKHRADAVRSAGFCAAAAAAASVAAQSAFAQGCAMCYQSAAASGAQGRAALRHGIAILFFPAASVFLGIFGLLYHRRNKSR